MTHKCLRWRAIRHLLSDQRMILSINSMISELWSTFNVVVTKVFITETQLLTKGLVNWNVLKIT